MRVALLLNSTYEVLSFITYKKIFKHIIKDSCEIIDYWDEEVHWASGKMKLPAVLRLKKHIKRNFINSNFSRKALIKRDKSRCLYCDLKLSPAQITVDHILPRDLGGITSFTNCVVACQPCNSKKGNFTLEQAGMKLLRKPTHPSFSSHYYYSNNHYSSWHPSWDDFLTNC